MIPSMQTKYRCDGCSIYFRIPDNLEAHKAYYCTGRLRPRYFCDMCGAEFNVEWDLKLHEAKFCKQMFCLPDTPPYHEEVIMESPRRYKAGKVKRRLKLLLPNLAQSNSSENRVKSPFLPLSNKATLEQCLETLTYALPTHQDDSSIAKTPIIGLTVPQNIFANEEHDSSKIIPSAERRPYSAQILQTQSKINSDSASEHCSSSARLEYFQSEESRLANASESKTKNILSHKGLYSASKRKMYSANEMQSSAHLIDEPEKVPDSTTISVDQQQKLFNSIERILTQFQNNCAEDQFLIVGPREHPDSTNREISRKIFRNCSEKSPLLESASKLTIYSADKKETKTILFHKKQKLSHSMDHIPLQEQKNSTQGSLSVEEKREHTNSTSNQQCENIIFQKH